MKKSVRIGIYVANTLLFVFLAASEFAFSNNIELEYIIILTMLFTAADVIGTKKQNIRHYIITIIIAIVALFGYTYISSIYQTNKDPNPNVLEM